MDFGFYRLDGGWLGRRLIGGRGGRARSGPCELPSGMTGTAPRAPRALVLRTAGTNCDAEMVRAFDLAGARTDLTHVDRLIADPAQIERFDLIGFPGGFSYGDDVASGRILAVRLRERLWPALRSAAARGVLMIGACNGFQVMVQAGLLPGPADGDWSGSEGPEQTVSLAHNSGGRFIDAWVRVSANAESPCVWTRPLADGSISDSDVLMLPIAHGEGRCVTTSAEVLEGLRERGQIALTYSRGENPNGSVADIAGLCDVGGRIFGLMPHPERYLDWTTHPFWTRLDRSRLGAESATPPGLRIFQAAVEAAQTSRV